MGSVTKKFRRALNIVDWLSSSQYPEGYYIGKIERLLDSEYAALYGYDQLYQIAGTPDKYPNQKSPLEIKNELFELFLDTEGQKFVEAIKRMRETPHGTKLLGKYDPTQEDFDIWAILEFDLKLVSAFTVFLQMRAAERKREHKATVVHAHS